jgi:hypothetical protein
MENNANRHRPNVLFNLVGLLLILAGIGITVFGIASIFAVMSDFDPFRGDGPPVRVANGGALMFWGVIVFTIGRYIWRGARTRGVSDRFGRFLIICAYLLLGMALDQGVRSAVGLWSAGSGDELTQVGIQTLIVFAAWGIPASIVGMIGIRLAKEKILAKASAKVDL